MPRESAAEFVEPLRLGGSGCDEEESGLDLDIFREWARSPWPRSAAPSCSLPLKGCHVRLLMELMEKVLWSLLKLAGELGTAVGDSEVSGWETLADRPGRFLIARPGGAIASGMISYGVVLDVVCL